MKLSLEELLDYIKNGKKIQINKASYDPTDILSDCIWRLIGGTTYSEVIPYFDPTRESIIFPEKKLEIDIPPHYVRLSQNSKEYLLILSNKNLGKGTSGEVKEQQIAVKFSVLEVENQICILEIKYNATRKIGKEFFPGYANEKLEKESHFTQKILLFPPEKTRSVPKSSLPFKKTNPYSSMPKIFGEVFSNIDWNELSNVKWFWLIYGVLQAVSAIHEKKYYTTILNSRISSWTPIHFWLQ